MTEKKNKKIFVYEMEIVCRLCANGACQRITIRVGAENMLAAVDIAQRAYIDVNPVSIKEVSELLIEVDHPEHPRRTITIAAEDGQQRTVEVDDDPGMVVRLYPGEMIVNNTDAPADGGVPFWKRPAISQYNYMRIQSLGLDLVSVVLATQKDTHIRAAAAELRRLLKGE